MIGVAVVGGLGSEDRKAPIGVAVCHPAFLGAEGPNRLELEVLRELVDDGAARGRVTHDSKCHMRSCLASWRNVPLVVGGTAVVPAALSRVCWAGPRNVVDREPRRVRNSRGRHPGEGHDVPMEV